MATRARRDYVEPGIYRRPGRGNYILVLKLSGRQYTEVLPIGVTLRSAREIAAKLRTESRNRSLLASGALTVGQLLDRWLLDRRITAKSYSSWLANGLDCTYWKETLGDHRVRDLKAVHVEGARDELLRNLSPKSVKNAISTLRRTLAWGVLPPYGTMLAIALLTCLRVESEWGGMRWQDVDLGQKVARLVHARMQDRRVIPAGNMKHKRRSLPLFDPAVRVLQAQLSWQAERKRVLGSNWLDTDGHIFTMPNGGWVHQSSLMRAFERMQREAGVPRMRVHDLGHTGATLLLLAGVHPKVVSETLGHGSVRTTLDWYSHVMPGLTEAAARTLGEFLSPARGNNSAVVDAA